MRIHNLLLESTNTEEQLAQLAANCSSFLSNPIPLFRGTNSGPPLVAGSPQIFYQRIRTDRKSLSKRHLGTLLFNMMFMEKFSVDRIRNQCCFTSTDSLEAGEYGQLWLAFPMNGSKMAYNPSIRDSLVNTRAIWHNITGHLRPHATDRDITVIANSLEQLDSPDATSDDLHQMVMRLSPATKSAFEEAWDDAAKAALDGYSVVVAGDPLPRMPNTEVMVFNSPTIALVHPSNILRNYRSDPTDREFMNDQYMELVEVLKRYQ